MLDYQPLFTALRIWVNAKQAVDLAPAFSFELSDALRRTEQAERDLLKASRILFDQEQS
jgi:hypothetical protein